MKQTITKDGSVTYFDTHSGEHYHSLSGAMEEAELKHLAPAKDFVKDNAVIIDFCFGLGYNTIATLAYAKAKCIKNLTIVCFENDLEIILKLDKFKLDDKYEPWRKMILTLVGDSSKKGSYKNYDYFEYEFEGYTAKLYLGDAKELLSLTQVNDR